MYHYVRSPRDKPLRGIRPFSTDEFEAQLDWLAGAFEIITPADLARISTGDFAPRRNWCLLTFDDGTKDHAQVVAPLLARRGLTGLFFFLSGPWVDRKLPSAHRVHVLLSYLEEEYLWNAICSGVNSEMGSLEGDSALGTKEDAQRTYSYEDSLFRMRIKYAINFALPQGVSERVIAAVVSGELGDEGDLVAEWFVTPDEALKMQAEGMVIGAHGQSHASLAQLSPRQLESEIRGCHKTLLSTLGEAPTWFAYPFGGSGETSGILEHGDRVLASLGYRASFFHSSSAQSWSIVEQDTFGRFDRYDCVALPPRAKSHFAPQ